MLFYVLLYLLGVVIGVVSPAESMKDSLSTLGAITLTALVASLLVPFAGFSQNERLQRFVMQYGIVPLFGLYSVLLYRGSSVAGVILFICAASVHFSYWTSGMHSRAYRLEQFRLGFASDMPKMARVIAVLNGQGLSNVADIAIKALLNDTPVNFDPLYEALSGQQGLIQQAEEEEAALTKEGKQQRHRVKTIHVNGLAGGGGYHSGRCTICGVTANGNTPNETKGQIVGTYGEFCSS